MLPHNDDISLLHQIEQQPFVDWRPVHELKEAVRQSAFQARDEIHVWRANADLFRQADLESWLSDGEKEKVRCFKFEQDRQRYVAAHAMLKQLLLAYTGLTVQQIEIKQARRGKPYLANSPSGIHLRFNLSHSGKAIVCIFSSRFEVGIDVEYMQNSIDWLLIAEQYFTVKEKMLLASVHPDRQLDAFYFIWTRKEALYKTIGIGLSGLDTGERDTNAFFRRGNTLFSFLFETRYQCSMSVSRNTANLKFFHYIL